MSANLHKKNGFYTQTDKNNQERNRRISHLCNLNTKHYTDENLRFRCAQRYDILCNIRVVWVVFQIKKTIHLVSGKTYFWFIEEQLGRCFCAKSSYLFLSNFVLSFNNSNRQKKDRKKNKKRNCVETRYFSAY